MLIKRLHIHTQSKHGQTQFSKLNSCINNIVSTKTTTYMYDTQSQTNDAHTDKCHNYTIRHIKYKLLSPKPTHISMHHSNDTSMVNV